MIPALVLSIAIRAEFGDPLRNKERQNGSNISISVTRPNVVTKLYKLILTDTTDKRRHRFYL